MAIIDDPSAYFQTKIYTGNGSARALTFDGNSDLQPDWVWIKKRAGGSASGHVVTDVVRGVNKQLFTNEVEAEESYTSVLTAFGSDGFSISTAGLCNTNTNTYVAWCWKAGTSFSNDASSTSIGSIDSTGSFNNDSGFSIVSYTGTATAGTIKHGLNIVPRLVITRPRTQEDGWYVYWHGNGATKYQRMETNAGLGAGAAFFNDTAPTSSVFSVGDGSGTNHASAYIAYCFANSPTQKISKYFGNGNASGPFCFTGFKPAWIMLKRADGSNSWCIFDSKRLGFNQSNPRLYANNTNASEGASDEAYIDILSNGFKLRGTQPDINNSTSVYNYLAVAENPFVTSTGVPATAR
tara:strand:- start:4 stop:1056 length:1053 start_codon:yes stop_codon:yes gene_type:complete